MDEHRLLAMDVHDLLLLVVLSLVIVGILVVFMRLTKHWGRPWIWGLAYVIFLAGVFPVCFLIDHDGFAQTDASQEPAFKNKLANVSCFLTDIVNTAIRQDSIRGEYQLNDIGYVTIKLEDADTHKITGTISYADSQNGSTASDLDSAMEIRESATSSAGNTGKDLIGLPYRTTEGHTDQSPSGTAGGPAAVAQKLFIKYSSSAHESKLYITADELSDVQALKTAAGGQVGIVGSCLDNWARMLYLSAVTMTTLGYGDIVPIEASTRIMITLEAVLGLLIFGFFINALWSRYCKSNGGG